MKGDDKHPVYQYLTADHDEPDWNFAKFLVGKDGKVIKRYAPSTKPDDPHLLSDVDAALNA